MQWPIQAIDDSYSALAEQWKTVSLAPRYEVSNLGRIRHGTTLVVKTVDSLSSEYPKTQLWVKGCKKNFLIHRLVADAFIPNPEGKPFVNHKDANKSNNIASNLEWATPFENYYHAACHGKMGKRLTVEDVAQMRALHQQGMSKAALSRTFGIARTSVRRIIDREVYV